MIPRARYGQAPVSRDETRQRILEAVRQLLSSESSNGPDSWTRSSTTSRPMVGSWHTNLHEYAARRLPVGWRGARAGRSCRAWVEDRALSACLLFYGTPHVLVAPNEALAALLRRRTGKPTYVMSRGVDTEMFSPARRTRTDSTLNIGYVGRLSPEKSVRVLADVERALLGSGHTNFRFTIVGDGGERHWVARQMSRATLTGVLRGEELAAAYANMDLFAFPSETETVGNVVLEAMASGLPIVTMALGGPRFVATSRRSALLAPDHGQFVDAVLTLAANGFRREAKGIAARAQALERSWDAVFDGLYRTYAAALSVTARGGTLDDRLSSRGRVALEDVS